MNIQNIHYHLLTFVTKYSRIPKENIALQRYQAVMETKQTPTILIPEYYPLILSTFEQEAKKLGISILVCIILPDHIHMIINSSQQPIEKIVQILKGKSAYKYNLHSKHQGSLRARGYSDTVITNYKYLKNAISYVENNHLKHGTSNYLMRKY